MSTPDIYIALPVLNEYENLEKLFYYLENQDLPFKKLVVCVNNYDHWWDRDDKIVLCENNLKSLTFLREYKGFELQLIDMSSPGKGWPGKKGGIGWARKTITDAICREANENDIIVSMDADTEYPENYLSAIRDTFESRPVFDGIALPYYHRLAGDETDRLILRYEIYMRNYLLNMLRIGNPYAFTALGSAMSFTAGACKRAGGLTPVKSGEDFYFLQKLVKNGRVSPWTGTLAYPSPRLSDRVGFGTGPALIKGKNKDWSSYPIYSWKAFDKVGRTFDLFGELQKSDIDTPMSPYLDGVFGLENLWEPLRSNYRDRLNFVRACRNKVDGLRILQFLRSERKSDPATDEVILLDNLLVLFPDKKAKVYRDRFRNLSFDDTAIEELNSLREILFARENLLRQRAIPLN
ncbi:MAG: glycosyltransferase family 2 protein [bacterium]